MYFSDSDVIVDLDILFVSVPCNGFDNLMEVQLAVAVRGGENMAVNRSSRIQRNVGRRGTRVDLTRVIHKQSRPKTG